MAEPVDEEDDELDPLEAAFLGLNLDDRASESAGRDAQQSSSRAARLQKEIELDDEEQRMREMEREQEIREQKRKEEQERLERERAKYANSTSISSDQYFNR